MCVYSMCVYSVCVCVCRWGRAHPLHGGCSTSAGPAGELCWRPLRCPGRAGQRAVLLCSYWEQRARVRHTHIIHTHTHLYTHMLYAYRHTHACVCLGTCLEPCWGALLPRPSLSFPACNRASEVSVCGTKDCPMTTASSGVVQINSDDGTCVSSSCSVHQPVCCHGDGHQPLPDQWQTSSSRCVYMIVCV